MKWTIVEIHAKAGKKSGDNYLRMYKRLQATRKGKKN